VAIPKVCGIETEYGIQLNGVADPNHVAASSLLINAYIAETNRKVGWDFEDEAPGRDARGFSRPDSAAPLVETHLVNAVLTNGARYYVDHAHPEFSTPECTNPLDLVRWDKAGEEILIRSMVAANRLLPPDQEIVIYKNNSDHKGNSYGCHENYLMDRAVPFARVVAGVMSHFVTRQIFTGAGKVGSEVPGGDPVDFQISQRADFFEEEVGLETTLKRPIVNTRDEPHADPKKYRRLHVIVGDANLCEVATFLKVGTTSIILAMIEDDFSPRRDLSLAKPVHALRTVSRDPELRASLELVSGGTMTALEIQWELLDTAKKYAESYGLEFLGGQGEAVLARWESVLGRLESKDSSLAAELDWVAKRSLMEAYRERHGCSWADSRMMALDLQYHDLRPQKSLFRKLHTEHLVTQEQVAEAVHEPPRDTRAFFRGRCLQRWSSSIAAANWDSLVFDLGEDPLRRVPMLEPLKGTAEMTEALFEGCRDAADLLTRLGS
jgi:proteasome accessory factor PafA2